MTGLSAALEYAAQGRKVFPCNHQRRPLTTNGFKDATTDPAIIMGWWARWLDAWVGFWPGPSDIAVLDIDMKNGKNGLATFVALDSCPIMPPIPTVRTPSGGWHLHYRMPQERIGSTVGAAGRGIGDGLDWRGDTGYVILPTPGSGYVWDRWHYGNCRPLPVPAALMPKLAPKVQPGPVQVPRLSQDSLSGALRFLMSVTEGERNKSLYWTSHRFAEAVDKGLIGADDARALLYRAGTAIGLAARETVATINSAFLERGHA